MTDWNIPEVMNENNAVSYPILPFRLMSHGTTPFRNVRHMDDKNGTHVHIWHTITWCSKMHDKHTLLDSIHTWSWIFQKWQENRQWNVPSWGTVCTVLQMIFKSAVSLKSTVSIAASLSSSREKPCRRHFNAVSWIQSVFRSRFS